MEKEITYQMNLNDWSVTNNGHVREVMTRELNLSRKEISRLKFDGEILLNGKRVRVDDHMRVGDTLTVRFPEVETGGDVPLLDIEPDILYEDADLVIVNKPAGIPCHPVHGHIDDSMGTILASYYRQAGDDFVIRPVGRLDKDVSGAIIYAKNRPAAARLSRDREDGKLTKYYTAFVSGVLETRSGVIDAPIAKVEGQRRRDAGNEEGKPAKTYFQVTHEFHVRNKSISILAVQIDTGRTHQIRAHLAAVGHPLIGDELYGGDTSLMKRPALHCAEITFLTPFEREGYEVTAPLPEDMEYLLRYDELYEAGEAPDIEETEAQGNAGDRILASLRDTSELGKLEEEGPAVREQTKSEKANGILRVVLILLILAAIAAFAVIAVRTVNERTGSGIRKEKEAIFNDLEVQFRPESFVEYGGDFRASDYVISASGTLSMEGTVDTMQVGTQEVCYTVTKEASDGSMVSRDYLKSFTVKDSFEPEIRLRDEAVVIALNQDYDPESNILSVSDPVDGKLDYTVTTDGFEPSLPGNYSVEVTASDSSGRKAVKTFTVTVSKDADPLATPSSETEPSPTAASKPTASSEQTAAPAPTATPVPTAAPATTQGTDTTAPEIVLITNEATITEGDSFNAGSLVSGVNDDIDGTLACSDSLTPGSFTVSSNVNPTATGTYSVTVSAMDRAGNRSDASVNVTVRPQPTPAPVTPAPTEEPVQTEAPSRPVVADSSDPKGQIYNFLTGTMGFNKAQACGILANMHRESRFNPKADNGLGYYGLCQWGFERKENLISWCEENGYDYTTIDGQLHFLQYEMPLYYPNTTAQLRAASDDEEGARRACWVFAIGYEVAGEYYAEMSQDKAAEYFNQ